MAVSIEGKAAVSMYNVRLPIITMHQFPKFVAGREPMQSSAITPHGPEISFWAQENNR